MKRIVSFFLLTTMLFSIFTVSVFADNEENVISETVEYFEDGSYMVSTLVEENSFITRATSTKSASRTSVIYNSSDEPMVTLKLTASFSYTGSSATCTSASTSYTLHSDNWKVTSAVASRSGNKAIGEFTSKRYTLLIPVQTINSTITITCSNSGTLS